MVSYSPPFILFNKHLETIYPSLVRKVNDIHYQRERITTADNDFLDLDWLKQNSKKLIILSHGLEGNSTRTYIKGMARIFFQNGYDILAWNYRGCSEEMNRTLTFYHSGATYDLDYVVRHVDSLGYEEINLVGFSLGGNLTLKYLGEKSSNLLYKIKKGVAISVPLNLYTSCLEISKSSNWIYTERFLKSLKHKVLTKSRVMPKLDATLLNEIKTLIDFDNCFTAPLHGFKNAIDYYEKCSSINFIEKIEIPTLILNAKNDPFLSADCFPQKISKNVTTLYPERGGHVGFVQFNQNGIYWSELKAIEFIRGQS
jgi:predicted alpha/beta-fold hydrolase